MKKLIMTKGLPASGKSTWAKEYQSENPNSVRVNKDDLRAMLHNSIWSQGREEFVLKVRNFVIEEALKAGHDVIVDDTNFASKHQTYFENIAKQYNAVFEIKDFTDVPVEECIKRDLKRQNSVGEKVIKDMYKQFLSLKKESKQIEFNPKLSMCILCDIDGTLAHMKNRGPFEWKKVGQDEPDPNIIGILNTYSGLDHDNPHWEETKIILFSGRDSVCRSETEKWLEENAIPYHSLYMRNEGDMRKDSIVKRELFDQYIKDKYNVLFVLDDRDQVVEMWRSLGLKCLQVAEGNF